MVNQSQVLINKETHRMRFRGIHECDTITIDAVVSNEEETHRNAVIYWDLKAYNNGERVKLTSKIFTAEEIEDIIQNERYRG